MQRQCPPWRNTITTARKSVPKIFNHPPSTSAPAPPLQINNQLSNSTNSIIAEEPQIIHESQAAATATATATAAAQTIDDIEAAATAVHKLGKKKVVKKTVKKIVKKVVKKKVPKSENCNAVLLDSLGSKKFNPIELEIENLEPCGAVLDSLGVEKGNPIELGTENLETPNLECNLAMTDCEVEEPPNLESRDSNVVLDSGKSCDTQALLGSLGFEKANPTEIEKNNLEPCSAFSVEKDTVVAEGNLAMKDSEVEKPPNLESKDTDVVLDSEKGTRRRAVKIVKKIVKKKVPKLVARNRSNNEKPSENGDTETTLDPLGFGKGNPIELETENLEPSSAVLDSLGFKKANPIQLETKNLEPPNLECNSAMKVSQIEESPNLESKDTNVVLHLLGFGKGYPIELETEDIEPCSAEGNLAMKGCEVKEPTNLESKDTIGNNASLDLESKDTNDNIASLETSPDVVLESEKGNRRRSVKMVKKIVKKKVPKLVARNSGKNEKVSENGDTVTTLDSVGIEKINFNSRKNEKGSKNGDTETNLNLVGVETENLEPFNDDSAEAEESKKRSLPPLEVEKATSDSEFGVTTNASECSILECKDITVVENANMDFLEAQTVVLDSEKDNLDVSSSDNEDFSKDHNLGQLGEEETKEAVDTSLRLNEGIIWSGEMEALERRRRRRTEIFIGGLDKETKEGDIRRIFEEVGEVVDVTLVINRATGKNKGFAFLRYASAADAKRAVERYSKVEISGKLCGVSLVEGNDTIYLGNIDKKWKAEDVVDLLKKAGIEKIDKVTVMTNPNNIEENRGFAFVELETIKEAQIAFNKLQKKDVFGKHMKVKVAWAQPLIEPNEEDMLKVKSVYAEYIPSSWNEEKVRDYFSKFGEVESITLAKDLPSSKRKDFAFVNYIGRESALACIDAFSHEPVNNSGSKVNMKVSLAKPMPKSKQTKRANIPSKTEPREEKKTKNHSISKRQEPNKRVNYTIKYREGPRVNGGSSTTNELLHLLRQQASGGQIHSGLRIGSDIDRQYSLSGNKRPFSAVVDNPHRMDSGGVSRVRLESSYPTASQSRWSHNRGTLGTPSFAHYRQLGGGHSSGSLYGAESFPSYFQSQERGRYGGYPCIYHRH